MSKIIRLYRHGETTWNAQGRLQGWLNSPLTAHGKQQTQQSQWQPEFVLSSDLGRAKQTARSMFPTREILLDVRLREIYLGNWQGQLISELAQNGDYKLYIQQPENFYGDKQESFELVSTRMEKVIEEAMNLPFQRIAIVSHGVAIACYMTQYKEQNWDQLWSNLLSGGQFFELKFPIFTPSKLYI